MRHIIQNESECLLTSVCQVVLSLNIGVERPYYYNAYHCVTSDSISEWTRTRFFEIHKAVDAVHYSIRYREPLLKDKLDLTKKGIIIISRIERNGRHAVSYEKNWILNPAENSVRRPQTIDEFLMELKIVGWYIEAVIPIDRD